LSKEDRTIGIVGLLLAIPVAIAAGAYLSRHDHAGLNLLFAGVATLAIYSLLYRENPIYRLFEHVFLGLAAGYAVVTAWSDVIMPSWYIPIFHEGKWLWLWVLPLALMSYFVFSRKHGWISRIPLVILAGFAAGQSFQAFWKQYAPQIRDCFKPLRPTMASLSNPNPAPDNLSISGAINNGIFILTLFAVLTYFLFSFEHKTRGVRNLSQLGRWLIMIGFGAIFGSTIMTRFALLVDRMSLILVEWLKVAQPLK
jgi:hypothetical protein